MAHRTERIEFRASAPQKERWLAATVAGGLHEASDFYRRACDELATSILGEPPAPRQAKPDPRRKTSRK